MGSYLLSIDNTKWLLVVRYWLLEINANTMCCDNIPQALSLHKG
jgi:hypothetical protein